MRVTAIDSDQAAIAALKRAAETTAGLKPIATEVRDLFRRPLIAAELKRHDCVMFDPPRQGAEAQARALAASAVPLVVAVSCNPMTFARDARILVNGGYRLTRVTPDGKKETVVETGGGPNGAAIGPDGAIWITNNGGSFEWLENQGMTIPGPTPASHTGGSIQRYDLTTGKLDTVYEACDGRRLIGPNDLVFDKQGGLWFTDHGCSTPEGKKYGGVYYAKPDGSHISRQRAHLISPNGIGLSPDEDVVYVADTNLGRLWGFDVAGVGQLQPPAGFAPGRVIWPARDDRGRAG